MKTRRNGQKTHKAEEELRKLISSGEFPPGVKIESLRLLSERLKIGKHPVEQAISNLVKEGLLITSHGRGTFVAGERTEYSKRMRLGVYIHIEQPQIDSMTQFHYCSLAGMKRNYDVLLANHGPHLNLKRWIQTLDGVIVCGFVDDALVRNLSAYSKPFLLFGNYSLNTDVPNLQIDMLKKTEALLVSAEKLIDYCKLGIMLGSTRFHSTTQVIEGCKKFAAKNRKEIGPDCIFTEALEYGYEPMKFIMEMPKAERPEVIIANIRTIEGASKYVEDKQLKKEDIPAFLLIGNYEINGILPNSLRIMAGNITYQSAGEKAIEWISSLVRKDGLFPSRGMRLTVDPDDDVLFRT